MELVLFFLVSLAAATLIIIILASCCNTGAVKRRRSPAAPSSTPPPGPWRLPVIGSMHHFLGGSKIPQRKLLNLSRSYGPLMHLKLGELDTIVVSSAEAASQVTRVHDLSFADRPTSAAMRIITYDMKDVVFAPYGGYWRQMRKICVVELLSAKRVGSLRSVREESAADLVDAVRSAAKAAAAGPVDLTKMVASFAGNMTLSAAFGKRCADREEFLGVVDKVKEVVLGFDVADFFPSWGFLATLSGIKRRSFAFRREIDRIAGNIIREHRRKKKNIDVKITTTTSSSSSSTAADEEEEEDLVDVLLRLQEHGGDLEFPLTDDSIKAIIFDMFAAGAKTTSDLIDWSMSEMMRNPRVMQKAQAEVREALLRSAAVSKSTSTKTWLREDDLRELEYLRLVIKETLRLHPPIPLLIPRRCRETCSVAVGGRCYTVPEGATVIINAWAIGRDPRTWGADAEEFRPERFDSDGNAAEMEFKGKNYEYIPFGSGRRMCPGMQFGLATVELALASLLCFFNWRLPPHITTPEDLDMTEAAGSGWDRNEHLWVHTLMHLFK